MPDDSAPPETDGMVPAGARVIAAVPTPRAAEHNLLLRAVPPDEYARVHPHLEPFELEVMQLLAEAGDTLQYVYFPERAIISVVRRLSKGAVVETGTIGREGMAGLSVALGDGRSAGTITGEVPGLCLRMPAETLRALLPELPALTRLLQRFALSFLDQVGQTAACNGVHPVERRCARWLLMTHDRVGEDQFLLTHEVLAQMLGVRRPGVTQAAGALKQKGLIRYSRGRVTVLDRAGLERAACECYAAVRANTERLLGAAGAEG